MNNSCLTLVYVKSHVKCLVRKKNLLIEYFLILTFFIRKQGISLVAYEASTNTQPYFINLDEDAFKSNRFMYIINKPMTVFGNKGDIQLMSLSVVRDHCRIRYDEKKKEVYLIEDKGDTWLNGKPVKDGTEVKIEIYDR